MLVSGGRVIYGTADGVVHSALLNKKAPLWAVRISAMTPTASAAGNARASGVFITARPACPLVAHGGRRADGQLHAPGRRRTAEQHADPGARGVASVRFLAGERTICTDTAAHATAPTG